MRRVDDERALRLASEHEDAETLGWTHGAFVWLARRNGGNGSAIAHATQACELAERQGDAFSRMTALFYIGIARQMRGESAEAIAALEAARALSHEARTGLESEAGGLGALAEALLGSGEQQRGLQVAEEAVATALERGNDLVLPLVHRILAEALLAAGGAGRVAAAKDELEKAITDVEATGGRGEPPFIEQVREKSIALR